MNWYEPSTPENIQPVPWLHPAAVAYLETLVSRETSVLEFGAGGSTLWFANKCELVTTYETNNAWAQAVRRNKRVSWIDSLEPPDGRYFYDILFIDGLSVMRPKWILAAPRLVRPGGVVVIDNAERVAYSAALTDLVKHTDGAPVMITTIVPQLKNKVVTTEFHRIKND